METGTGKTTEKILKLIMDNPQISQDKIAEIIGITTDGLFWNIKKFKAQGVIERVGHDKGGCESRDGEIGRDGCRDDH
ncbi:MAG: winged helix-turn-helix domain-containing protein [Tannerella sp.]|nr:winged helix-turn-helix domain-containing protein [Tannerella sp.]